MRKKIYTGKVSHKGFTRQTFAHRRQKLGGFTLIEILIVVAIIAILASVVLVGLGPTQQSGRDARRLSDIRQIQTGLELYFSKCGYYPGTVQSASPCGSFSATNFVGLSGASGALTQSGIGISTIPNDPTAGHQYYYATGNSGANYILAATLENKSNSAFVNYTVPSLSSPDGGDTMPNGCVAPTYCLTL